MEKINQNELEYQTYLITNKKLADAAWQHWSAFMIMKYNINDQDQLLEDGTIIRAKTGD